MEIAGDLVLDKYLLDRCNRTMWATIFDIYDATGLEFLTCLVS